MLSLFLKILNPFVFLIELLNSSKHLIALLYFLLAILNRCKYFDVLFQFAFVLGDIRFKMLPGPDCLFDFIHI